jgi:hypothetical protein
MNRGMKEGFWVFL